MENIYRKQIDEDYNTDLVGVVIAAVSVAVILFLIGAGVAMLLSCAGLL